MIKNDAIEIWKAGVSAVHGQTLVEESVRLNGDTLTVNAQSFDLDDFSRILVVGGGKFSHFMAKGLENVLGKETCQKYKLNGIVTVPDGSDAQVDLSFIEAVQCRPAGVNLPTQRVFDATDRMLELLQQCDDRTLVIALISGGGSALIESTNLTLETVIATTQWLSLRGADIIQLNKVRIAMSAVKGGGLARAMPAGTMIGLIVSDVPGDDIRFVSSGPTVPYDMEAVDEALAVFDAFGARTDPSFPYKAWDLMAVSGFTSQPPAALVHNFMIGNAEVALKAASSKAKELGYEIQNDILKDSATCEDVASQATEYCVAECEATEAVVSLGEPTVTPGDGAGQGGRNQHAVLLAIQKLLQSEPTGEFCFLSGGTDGEDGNTAVAGALICDSDVTTLRERTDQIQQCLAQFDSHSILSQTGLVFESGPTGTNVADLRILLRRPR